MTRGRFAPSPTGRMHLGNVFCALLSWLSAKSKGGEWVLRIEDLDPQRSKREYALQLMDDLQWLGLTWDGDPVWQSQRGDIYEHHLKQLATMQMIYPCYCTRADIMATQAPHETDGRIVYKGTCRPEHHSIQSSIPSPSDSLSPSENSLASTLISQAATIRLMVPDENIPFVDGHYGEQSINLTEHCGDYIIRRKDGAWAYQLAVVIDDALMGVNEIVRGRDLLLSSPQQIHLRKVLFPNKSEKVNFIHHPLLCNMQGQRLCKRDKSMDLGFMRQEGKTAKEIIGYLAHLAGLTDKAYDASPQELLPLFSWHKISREDILVE